MNVFAKATIILSYPHVYRFKPIYYVMIVTVLNYHSSIITIMAKDDNMLCINYTIKTGTVREQVRNLLKRLLFSSRQAFLLSKTACKAAWDPGVPTTEARVWERCRPGSARGLCGGVGCLSAVLDAFLCPVFASFPAKKVVLYLNASVLSMVIIWTFFSIRCLLINNGYICAISNSE